MSLWSKYNDDISRQEQVAAIKKHGAVSVITTGMENGSLWTGDINYLYFDSDIEESQVLQILDSPGLDQLERVVFKQTPITDKTLARLKQMPSLRSIYVEGGQVSEGGVESLIHALPRCRVEIGNQETGKIGLGHPPEDW